MLLPEVGDLLRETMVLILKMSTPVLLVALVIGVVVSLIQALIQVQEQTLTFVPKLFAVFACLLLVGGMMTTQLMIFTESLFKRAMEHNTKN